MILKTALILSVAMLAAGCQTTSRAPIIVPKNVVVRIPEEFLQCSRVVYPNADTLTDKQVARLLIALDRANSGCRLSIDQIRRLQDAAVEKIEGKK